MQTEIHADGCAGSGRRRIRLRGCPPPAGLLLDAAAPNAPPTRSGTVVGTQCKEARVCPCTAHPTYRCTRPLCANHLTCCRGRWRVAARLRKEPAGRGDTSGGTPSAPAARKKKYRPEQTSARYTRRTANSCAGRRLSRACWAGRLCWHEKLGWYGWASALVNWLSAAANR